MAPEEYNYEYLYITFDQYSEIEEERIAHIDVVNEMERAVNVAIQEALPNLPEGCLLNPFKGTGFVKKDEKVRRAGLRTTDRMDKVTALISAVRQNLGLGCGGG